MMNAFKITREEASMRLNYMPFLLLGLLLLLWPMLQGLIMRGGPKFGYVDPNIWLLILLSLICFMIIIGLCWWLLQRFWTSLGLPSTGNMVLQYKQLPIWQQLGFYWASFGLLLLAAVGVLIAIL